MHFATRLGAPFVPVIFKTQSYDTQPDANENNEENTPDILDANSVALILDLGTLCLVEFPPFCLQILEVALVQELQDAINQRIIADLTEEYIYIL